MKLSIRFADQIVGAFIILALGILVFVIFMLGRSQRWFARDYEYYTYMNSASGVSQNMPVQYKGFTIGRVKEIKLSEDDRVEVSFVIFDNYNDRVREGSLVEVQVSPIGLGNQFIFYPGTGKELLAENSLILSVNTVDGRRAMDEGSAMRPERDDSINNIMNLVSTLLVNLNATLEDVQGALEGTDQTSIGRTIGGIEDTVSGIKDVSASVDVIIKDVTFQLNQILQNINEITASLADPSGAVREMLDTEGPVYGGLVDSMGSITGTLKNLEKTSDFFPDVLPQLSIILMELHSALRTADDVLTALANNPILKGGIPQRNETGPGGTRPRDLEF